MNNGNIRKRTFSAILLTIFFNYLAGKPAQSGDEKKGDTSELDAAAKVCEELYKVTLIPSDMESMKLSPRDTLVAADAKQNNLVPVATVTWFMRPGSAGALNAIPENVSILFKKSTDMIASNPTASGMIFTFLKPELARLVGDEKKPEDESPEDEEEAPAEEPAGEAPAGEGAAPAGLKPSQKKK